LRGFAGDDSRDPLSFSQARAQVTAQQFVAQRRQAPHPALTGFRKTVVILAFIQGPVNDPVRAGIIDRQ